MSEEGHPPHSATPGDHQRGDRRGTDPKADPDDVQSPSGPEDGGAAAVWRALANPTRRRIMDLLRDGPRTTQSLSDAIPDLTRYAVMQHLDVLTAADLVLIRREGRHRYNYANAVPLQRVYERWVSRWAGDAATEALHLWRAAESPHGGIQVTDDRDQFRVVRIENELRFQAPPDRVFEAITARTREWFPASYGEERTQEIVLEPRIGGLLFERWDGEAAYLYGQVTLWDPPSQVTLRTRLHPGTTMDTTYTVKGNGASTTLSMSRVVCGPISEEQALNIHRYGDLTNFEDALRSLLED